MLVVDENAERKLLKLLEKYKGMAVQGRAVHVRISRYGVMPLAMTEFIELTKSIIQAADLQFFVMHDGDIVLIAEKISSKEARSFNEALTQRMGLPVTEDVTQLLEIEHSWNYLVYLLDDKIQVIQTEKNKKLRLLEDERRAQERESILAEDIPPELVRTLAKRRSQHTRPVIMIVEDDGFIRRLVDGVLRDRYDIVSLGGGRDMMKHYLMRAPDVVFLDIKLPDVSGHELLKKVVDIDPDSYVIMLSGNGDLENVKKATELGAKGFIGKPFTKDRLETYVARCPRISSSIKDV